MQEQLTRIKSKLQLLKQQDRHCKLFGAQKHRYQLNPTSSLAEIERLESKYNIKLPEGYTLFLTTIGNGGVGPYYGLEPLENALFDDLDYKRPDGLLDPSKPFPHTQHWNMTFAPTVDEEEDDEEFEKQQSAFEEAYFDNAHRTGTITICNYGCGTFIDLVVNGGDYGFVWMIDRVNDQGIYPYRTLDTDQKINFLDWYESWLDSSLEKINRDQLQTDKTSKPWWRFW